MILKDFWRASPPLNLLKVLICGFVAFLVVTTFLIEKELECLPTLFSAKGFGNDGKPTTGCVLRKFNHSAARECSSKRRSSRENQQQMTEIHFVGTQYVKDFYTSFINQFSDGNPAQLTTSSDGDDPLVLGMRVSFVHSEFPNNDLRVKLLTWQSESAADKFVVLGFNPPQSTIEAGSIPDWIDSILYNASSMAFELDLVAAKGKVVWAIPSHGFEDAARIYKAKVDDMLKGSHVEVWDVDEGKAKFPPSAGYFGYENQVLLNYFCNSETASELTDSTVCCSPKFKPMMEAKMVLSAVVIVGLMSLVLTGIYHSWRPIMETLENMSSRYCSYLKDVLARSKVSSETSEVLILETGKEKETFVNPYVVLLVKCVLIFGYFFVCDRTDVFEKERKSFSYEALFFPLVVFSVLGVVLRGTASKSAVMGREITDEWKGWMQICILFYHFTGASSHLHIYMHVRILVSSYLFMSGFGNFCYYWQGGVLSFRRYCQVMFRMNFLVALLCVVMKREYQFYYFVPLVSFWYSVLFLLLLMPPSLTLNSEGKYQPPSNKDYAVALIKLSLLFGAITALSLSKSSFDAIFTIPYVRSMFVIPGSDDYEWWFRWQLDKYSIFYGVMFALIYKKVSQAYSYEEVIEKRPWLKTSLKLLVGSSAVASYSFIFTLCSTKQQCNVIHPYVVWIPIIGYVLMRNASESLRSQYAFIMVEAGKISLELFICQYHIWLAADTRGILILLPWAHWTVNYTVVSVVFVFVAYEVNVITAELTSLVFPKDNKIIVRNLFVWIVGFIIIRLIL